MVSVVQISAEVECTVLRNAVSSAFSGSSSHVEVWCQQRDVADSPRTYSRVCKQSVQCNVATGEDIGTLPIQQSGKYHPTYRSVHSGRWTPSSGTRRRSLVARRRCQWRTAPPGCTSGFWGSRRTDNDSHLPYERNLRTFLTTD